MASFFSHSSHSIIEVTGSFFCNANINIYSSLALRFLLTDEQNLRKTFNVHYKSLHDVETLETARLECLFSLFG